MRTNYHTHTSRCNHAAGTDAQYVEAAITGGYSSLGFSDHCPWPFTDWFNIPVRMAWDELSGYIQSIRALRSSYKDRIDILCGLECEYFPSHADNLSYMRERVDYMILGQHYDTAATKEIYVGDRHNPPPLRKYIDPVIEGMSTGLFACLAHPDLFLLPYDEFTPELRQLSRELCQAAKLYDIPLEYNLYGLRKQVSPPNWHTQSALGYPCPSFWRIAAEEGATAIIGVDAHEPKALLDPELALLAGMYLDALGVKRVDTLVTS